MGYSESFRFVISTPNGKTVFWIGMVGVGFLFLFLAIWKLGRGSERIADVNHMPLKIPRLTGEIGSIKTDQIDSIRTAEQGKTSVEASAEAVAVSDAQAESKESLPVSIDIYAPELSVGYPMPDSLRLNRAVGLALEKSLMAYARLHGDFPQGESAAVARTLVKEGILEWPAEWIGKDGGLLDANKLPLSIKTAPGKLFVLASAGPDKAFGTQDDFVLKNFE